MKELEGKKPLMCYADTYQSSALFIYETTTSEKVWMSCADCQLKDYEKWPSLKKCKDATDDIPFSKEIEDIIKRKCSIDTDISLPSCIVSLLSSEASHSEMSNDGNNKLNECNSEMSNDDNDKPNECNSEMRNDDNDNF